MSSAFSQRTVAGLMVVGWLGVGQSFAAGPATRPGATCAILTVGRAAGDASADVASLAEARLGESGGVTLIDRQHVGPILEERQLQRLLAPDAVAARAEAGRLLRADLLALIVKADGGRSECVVCDTYQGVRLARFDLDPAKPQAAADAVVAAVVEAAGRADAVRRHALPLVAVPPFVSKDLLYESDYLRAAYARLAEAAVRRAGGVTIEWREANALAAEVAVAGDGEPLRRTLPTYLNGEFRSSTSDGKATRTVTVRGVRGRDELWTATETLANEDVPAFLLRAGERAATAAGATAAAGDSSLEAAQIAARAETSVRLGEWSDAAALLEAALLLTPDDRMLHRRAMIAYAYLTRGFLDSGGDATLETVRGSSETFFRGFDHLESYLARTSGDELRAERDPGRISAMWELFYSTSFRKAGYKRKDVTAAFDVQRKKAIDRLLRLAELRARTGQGDDASFVIHAAGNLGRDDDEFDIAFRAVERVQDLPNLTRRVFEYGGHGITPDVLDTPQGRAYLDRVEALPNPAAKAAVKEIRAAMPQIVAMYEKQRVEMAAATQPVRPAPGEASTYRAVSYTSDSGERIGRIHRLTAACPGVDVFQVDNALYLSKARGRATRIWTTNERNGGAQSLCYDGRYAWAVFKRYPGPPLLLRIDPRTGETTPVGQAVGLPQPTADSVSDPNVVQRLVVAPLSPGRVMLAGFFGRSYLATAEVNADGGTSVSVFHEAKEQLIDADDGQWRRTTVAFEPSCVVPITLTNGPGGRPMTRVLVGRGIVNGSYLSHPLVVDPETKQITVIEDDVYLRDDRNVAVQDGVLYFAWPTWQQTPGNFSASRSSANVWRLALPGLRKELVRKEVYPFAGRCERFACTFLDGRFVVAGMKTNVADTPAGPYAAAGSTLPFPANRSVPQPHFMRSNHYGTLFQFESDTIYEMTQFAAPKP